MRRDPAAVRAGLAVGGADPARGSGPRGLIDRVEALDGRLVAGSAPGRRTRLRAEIPVA